MGRLFSLKGTAGPDGCNIAHVRELCCVPLRSHYYLSQYVFVCQQSLELLHYSKRQRQSSREVNARE